MMRDIFRSAKNLTIRRGLTFAILTFIALGVITPVLAAQDEPRPDPAGIATGDKNNVVDAAGTPLVVAEPTDKNASDYADKKKADDHRPRIPLSCLTRLVMFAALCMPSAVA